MSRNPARSQRLAAFYEAVRLKKPLPVFCPRCGRLVALVWGTYQVPCGSCGAQVSGVRL
jgi:ribosomal protein S27AE